MYYVWKKFESMKTTLPILSGIILTCASLNAQQTTVFAENFNSSTSMPSSIVVGNYNNDGDNFSILYNSGGVNEL